MSALIAAFVGGGGALGVFLLMLIENVFPPIPSELILPFAGYAAAQGKLSLAAAVLAGTAGSAAGASVWYALGRWAGRQRLEAWIDRHGRWLAITPHELRRAQRWAERNGAWAVVIGRMLPGVRGVICIPAGVSGMRLAPFLVWCTVGSFGWSLLLCGAGFWLREHFASVEQWLRPVAWTAFLGFGAVYLYRVATFSQAHRSD